MKLPPRVHSRGDAAAQRGGEGPVARSQRADVLEYSLVHDEASLGADFVSWVRELGSPACLTCKSTKTHKGALMKRVKVVLKHAHTGVGMQAEVLTVEYSCSGPPAP